MYLLREVLKAMIEEQKEYALNNPLSLGDRVYPHDGSAAVVLEKGKLSHQHVAYLPIRKTWIVIALGGLYPTDRSHNYEGNNNCMCVREDNKNIVLFINKEYLRKVE